MKPLAVDLCAGLGGWSEGLLAEGWDVVGFDVERHQYGHARYPAQLVLQDILTIDGKNFRGHVSLIVASPPCQKYSYMAMPWRRSKELARWYRDPQHPQRLAELNALFDACLRIAREAECPIVIENVRGAQPWVGRARATFGSFYLWGDVPALMPITRKHVKVPTMGAGWYPPGHPKHVAGLAFNGHAERAFKNTGGSWFAVARNTTSGKGQNPDGRKTTGHINQRDGHSHTRHLTNQAEHDGYKGNWLEKPDASGKRPLRGQRATWSGSTARKAASAHIAKIPFVLARHIARVYHPETL